MPGGSYSVIPGLKAPHYYLVTVDCTLLATAENDTPITTVDFSVLVADVLRFVIIDFTSC